MRALLIAWVGIGLVLAPGTGLAGVTSRYALIVANDHAEEGSYGEDSLSAQRPEHSGTPGCDYGQNLGGVTCE